MNSLHTRAPAPGTASTTFRHKGTSEALNRSDAASGFIWYSPDTVTRAGATELAGELSRLGFEVLLDDRTSSPGVKFKDAELLGMPWIVVVGRGWADGVVELRNRFSGETRELAVDGAGAEVAAALRANQG